MLIVGVASYLFAELLEGDAFEANEETFVIDNFLAKEVDDEVAGDRQAESHLSSDERFVDAAPNDVRRLFGAAQGNAVEGLEHSKYRS